MGRGIKNVLAKCADNFSHGSDGVSPFPWGAGVGSMTLHINFVPCTAFVRHLDLSVCRLCIDDPVFGSDPAGPYAGFRTAHKVFLIHRTDEFECPFWSLTGGMECSGCHDKSGQAAGQTGFHIAGAPAIDFPVLFNGFKRRQRPSVSDDNGIHMADHNQGRKMLGPGNFRHQIRTSRQNILPGN